MRGADAQLLVAASVPEKSITKPASSAGSCTGGGGCAGLAAGAAASAAMRWKRLGIVPSDAAAPPACRNPIFSAPSFDQRALLFKHECFANPLRTRR